MADNNRMKEQLKEITERLEQGIQEVFESEKYKEYLNTMSKFYNYSFNNTLLIAMQKPESTLIAGYQAWQNKFERHVKRGEKGIRIIAPAPIVKKEEMEKLDPETQEPMLDEQGKPIMEVVEIRMPAFKIIPVFDVSQTEGKELPDLTVDELAGTVENYEIFMQALTEVAPVPIGYEEIPDGAKGYYHLEEKRIAIQEGMSEIQNIKTAIHETAHATLHDIDLNNPELSMEERKDRKTKEVEAESIAYTVCQHYGIDTSDYSFGYVAGWSSDKELKELRSSLETIRKTSATLINAIDEKVAELQLAKAQELEQQEVSEPIKDTDVIVMVSGSMGSEYEVDKITNMQPEEIKTILEDMTQLPEEEWEGDVQAYLEERGAEIVPIMSSSGLWDGYPPFYDFEYDFDTNKVSTATELSPIKQAENLINRMEFDRSVFNDEERNLIVNYTYQFANMEKTEVLAMKLRDALDDPDVLSISFVMEQARKEIEALPDQMMSFTESNEYGYTDNHMYPLTKGRALELWEKEFPVMLLYPDNTEAYAESVEELETFDGIFGIEKEVWDREKERETTQVSMEEIRPNPEDLLLNGEQDSFGIYQLKSGEELHYHRFESLDSLERHGLQVEKDNYELIYTAPLQEGQTLDNIFEQFNLFRPEDFTGHSLSVSDIVLLHKNGTNTVQYVDSIGFREIPNFLEKEKVTEQEPIEADEMAFQIADRYLTIQTVDEGYDYSIYDDNYQLLDGGIYDSPDLPIMEVVNELVADLKEPMPGAATETYYRNKIQGNVSHGDELIPLDYEEFIERAEQANRIEAVTEQPEASLNQMTRSEIEETVLAYAQTKAKEYDYDVQVIAAKVYGSRTAAIEKEDSDLDVVIEYKGDIREDDFFSMLHEDGLSIGGMALDINPISEEKSGTMEEYLARANEYLEEKVKSAREMTSDKEKVEVVAEEPAQTLTFYVAECMEFTSLGEYHENLTLEEAVRLYESIPAERMNGIKGIGFVLHKEGDEPYMDDTMAILDGGIIDVDTINHVLEFRENPLVQQAVKDVLERFPDAEMLDRETKARESQVAEETLDKKYNELAVEIDQFAQDYDPHEYGDAVEDKEQNINTIYHALYNGDAGFIKEWLNGIIEEEEPVEDVAKATELMKRMDDLVEKREKNPMAKVEELEEANYNQIDGFLNNQKPKEQEKAESQGLSIMEKLERNREKIASEHPKEKPPKETEKKTEREDGLI